MTITTQNQSIIDPIILEMVQDTRSVLFIAVPCIDIKYATFIQLDEDDLLAV